MTNPNPEMPRPADTESTDHDKEALTEKLRLLSQRLDTIIDEADPSNDSNVTLDRDDGRKSRQFPQWHLGYAEAERPVPRVEHSLGDNYDVEFTRTPEPDTDVTSYKVGYRTKVTPPDVQPGAAGHDPYGVLNRSFEWELDSHGNIVERPTRTDPEVDGDILVKGGADINNAVREDSAVSGEDALKVADSINALIDQGLSSPEGIRWEEGKPATFEEKEDSRTAPARYDKSMREEDAGVTADGEKNPSPQDWSELYSSTIENVTKQAATLLDSPSISPRVDEKTGIKEESRLFGNGKLVKRYTNPDGQLQSYEISDNSNAIHTSQVDYYRWTDKNSDVTFKTVGPKLETKTLAPGEAVNSLENYALLLESAIKTDKLSSPKPRGVKRLIMLGKRALGRE